MRQLKGNEQKLVNILIKVSQSEGNFDDLIAEALTVFSDAMLEEREKASSELRRILRSEVYDANERIRVSESNPLYWLNRRFEQLADEIGDGDYDEKRT